MKKHKEKAIDYFKRHQSNECFITSDGRVFHNSGAARGFASSLENNKIEHFTRTEVKNEIDNETQTPVVSEIENSKPNTNLETQNAIVPEIENSEPNTNLEKGNEVQAPIIPDAKDEETKVDNVKKQKNKSKS